MLSIDITSARSACTRIRIAMKLQRWLVAFATSVAALVHVSLSLAADPSKEPLLVFAAASLTNVMEDIGKAYTQETGQPVKFSFASSSALARQIEAGARADVFISADTEWMDYSKRAP